MHWIASGILLISLSVGIQSLSPQSFLSLKEIDYMTKEVFEPLLSNDLNSQTRQSLHYAIAGFKLLGKSPSPKLCDNLNNKLASAKEISHLFDVSVPFAHLSCSLTPEKKAEALKILQGSDLSTPAGLYHAYFSSKKLSLPFSLNEAALEEALSAGIKADNSLMNLGYAFHIAGEEGSIPKKSLPVYYTWIEDALAQADEVDGKFLQFEGGLATTNFVLSGIFKLSSRADKAPPLTEAQLIKFVNYFMNRKSVQSVKGAYNLLEGIQNLSSNKFFEPVAVTLASPGVISDASPKIRIRVSDLFGKPLSGKFDVTIESATPKDSKASSLLKGTKMGPVAGEASLFEVDMKSLKPTKGFYNLLINVNGPQSSSKKHIGLKGVSFPIKVSSVISIENVAYSVGDVDQSASSTKSSLKYPEKFSPPLKLDPRSKFTLKFNIKDKETSGNLMAHQVFLRLSNQNSEIIYMAEADGEKYKFEFNVAAKASDFNDRSGKYSIELIIGDVLISNPMTWTLGELDINFSSTPSEKSSSPSSGPLPEIKHLFREPEKRPPGLVSNAFMVLCLAPILIMFVSWAKIGVNVSGFPFSLPSFGFHFGLGAIFVLYFYFWLKLNMFTTMKYLIVIGIFTFICGNSMLAQIAKKKKT